MSILIESPNSKVSGGLLPDRAYLAELARPWKLLSFAIGMGWLLFGALNYGISDWDIGVSLLMGGLTYLSAPWSVRTILAAVRYRSRGWFLGIAMALFVAWVVVDGVYALYHTIMGNQMFRIENFFASSALYFLAGSIWLYRGSLREFLVNVRRVFRSAV
jgi:hypothetical protein